MLPLSQSNHSNGPFKTVAGYFEGIGLVRMGLERAGWTVIFANDFAPAKHEMHRAFFGEGEQHYQVDDIFNIDPATVPATLLATCSFPCIDLSLAGNMSGIHGEHSSAFWGFTRILEAQGAEAPPLIMVENVVGWLTSNKGADFRVTITALNQAGYACDVIVLNAQRFTPQSRPRVFVIGQREARGTAKLDFLLNRSAALAPTRLKSTVEANANLRWSFLDIPEPPPLLKEGLSKIVEAMPADDRRWWSGVEVQRHLNMMDVTHRAEVERLLQLDELSYRTFFRRRRKGLQRVELRKDDIAGCLRTAVGGSSKQFLLAVGQGEIKMRVMTSREYARLQGVPNQFRIRVDENQALTGFGDAVCVPVITWIASHVLNPLAQRIARPQTAAAPED